MRSSSAICREYVTLIDINLPAELAIQKLNFWKGLQLETYLSTISVIFGKWQKLGIRGYVFTITSCPTSVFYVILYEWPF